jgi:polyhydroxybutyrate depolymerase
MKTSAAFRIIAVLGLVVIVATIGYIWLNSPLIYLPGATVRNTLTSAGERRQFLLHVPTSLKSGEPVPLVLNFHGYGSNAAEQELISEMSPLADSAGFIVVYPQGLGNPPAWQTGPEGIRVVDQIFIRDLVQLLAAKFNIDSKRIYAAGISNGAQIAIRLGCEMADTFAAVASVSGSFPPAGTCAPLQPVPLIAFHGTADRSLPYNGAELTGGFLPPIRDGVAEWANRNGCATIPTNTYQSGDVTGETWSGCQGNADVSFYTIQYGGHTWPGSSTAGSNAVLIYDIASQDIEASQAIWEFFYAHPRR